MAPLPSSPTPIGDLAANRKPTHRRPGEGRSPGAGHGYRLNARHRPTPIFPNGPPSVIPDPDRGSRRKPEPTTTVAPAKAGAQGRGMATASTPDIDQHPSSQTAPLPSSPTPIGDLAANRKPTPRRHGEGRGPGAGHGNRLNARYRPTPIFPNGPPSVIPDTDRGSAASPLKGH